MLADRQKTGFFPSDLVIRQKILIFAAVSGVDFCGAFFVPDVFWWPHGEGGFLINIAVYRTTYN